MFPIFSIVLPQNPGVLSRGFFFGSSHQLSTMRLQELRGSYQDANEIAGLGSRALRSEIASFAFIVDPKDETAARFYGRYRFLPLASGSQCMFLPVAEIAGLFG